MMDGEVEGANDGRLRPLAMEKVVPDIFSMLFLQMIFSAPSESIKDDLSERFFNLIFYMEVKFSFTCSM